MYKIKVDNSNPGQTTKKESRMERKKFKHKMDSHINLIYSDSFVKYIDMNKFQN